MMELFIHDYCEWCGMSEKWGMPGFMEMFMRKNEALNNGISWGTKF
jgi:hypothetical protein